MKTLALIVTAWASVAATPALPSNTDLLTVDQRIQSSMVAGDIVYLKAHLAPDFRFTHGLLEGDSERRADVLRNAALRPRYYIRREVSSAVAEIHNNTGLVVGRLSVTSGPLLSDADRRPWCYALNFVHLYRRRHKTWQLLSHRTAQMITPPAPC